jgi:hypothetical protein
MRRLRRLPEEDAVSDRPGDSQKIGIEAGLLFLHGLRERLRGEKPDAIWS